MQYLRDRLLGQHKQGIIFVHIPKTGGSSISASLRKHYRLSKFNIKSEVSSLAAEKRFGHRETDPDFDETVHRFRLALIFYEAEKRTRFITGHFSVNERLSSLKPLGYKIITCLRDPVDRWFSHFFYLRFKKDSYGRIEQDIEAFLQTPRAMSLGSTYVRYLGGLRENRDYTSRSAVDTAKDNLEMFDLIGFLHSLESFLEGIEEATGFRPRIMHRRKSPADPVLQKKIRGSTELRSAVEKLCQGDREVYEKALSMFNGRDET